MVVYFNILLGPLANGSVQLVVYYYYVKQQERLLPKIVHPFSSCCHNLIHTTPGVIILPAIALTPERARQVKSSFLFVFFFL